MSHYFANTPSAPQRLHARLFPAAGRRWVFMQEVSAKFQLKFVDIHRKSE
jgi:hypothetical protein